MFEVVLLDIWGKEYSPRWKFEDYGEAYKFARNILRGRIYVGEKAYIWDSEKGRKLDVWKRVITGIKKIR